MNLFMYVGMATVEHKRFCHRFELQYTLTKSESTATRKNKSHDSPLRDLTMLYASTNACSSSSMSDDQDAVQLGYARGCKEMNHDVSLKL